MQFTARLTTDPEIRTVKNDRKVTRFTVAVNKRWKSKNGEKHEKTNFIECAYWVNSGVAEYLKKGTVVDITGWVDAQAWMNRDCDAKAGLRCDVETLKLYGVQQARNEQVSGAKKKAATKANAGKMICHSKCHNCPGGRLVGKKLPEVNREVYAYNKRWHVFRNL